MQKTDAKIADGGIVEKMFVAGAHYGYGRSRRHPSASPYIFTTKNKTDIIDLEKTSLMLERAAEFAKTLGARGKVVLFVGTKPPAKSAIKTLAESLNMPFVIERWIGGTLSNFSEIKKRIAELQAYRQDSKEGNLEKYTKKERLMLAKKMEKLSKYYSGLTELKKAPDALFIIDPKEEYIAATEGRKQGIPIIGLLNSDSDISSIDYPILGNDAAIPSIAFFAATVVQAYREGQSAAPIAAKVPA